MYTTDISGNKVLLVWKFPISYSMNSSSFVLFALFFSTPPNEILMQLPNLNKKFY